MEEVLEFGLSATSWLQQTYPALRGFMLIVTDFGRFELYLLLLPLIYWCLDKKIGASLSYLLVISTLVNAIAKHWLRGPRPYWLDASLGLTEAGSYGVPSGHTQTAVVVALVLAGWSGRSWARILAFVYIFLMGVSRIYLGVHFVHDVVLGLLVGLAILMLSLAWQQWLSEPFFHWILGQRLLIAVAVPLGLGAIYAVVLLMLGDAQTSVPWASHIPLAEEESMEAVVEMVAAMVGMGVGFMLEQTIVYFRPKSYLPQLVLRYIIGMVGAIAIWLGLRMVFAAITPEGYLFISFLLRFIRYMLLTLWIAYYAPKLFVALGFADQSDVPDVSFGVEGAVVRESKD